MERQGIVVWVLMAALLLSNLVAIGNIGDVGKRRICSGILSAIILTYMVYEALV